MITLDTKHIADLAQWLTMQKWSFDIGTRDAFRAFKGKREIVLQQNPTNQRQVFANAEAQNILFSFHHREIIAWAWYFNISIELGLTTSFEPWMGYFRPNTRATFHDNQLPSQRMTGVSAAAVATKLANLAEPELPSFEGWFKNHGGIDQFVEAGYSNLGDANSWGPVVPEGFKLLQHEGLPMRPRKVGDKKQTLYCPILRIIWTIHFGD